MKLPLIFLTILCLFVAGAAVFIWSGFYNVAANVPHWRATEWVMEEAREQSILTHSKGIRMPSTAAPRLVNAGFQHYHAMCRLCHNAPGYTRTEISQGLYPSPPDFSKKETKLPDNAGVFWIVKNGIKMTGMPAFGSTHDEEELWGIASFAKRVPSMEKEEYGSMVKALRAHKDTGHRH